MSEATQETVILQAHNLAEEELGISPVLLQAVNQTLDSNKVGPTEQVIEISESEAIVAEDSELPDAHTIVIASTEETVSQSSSDADDNVVATTAPAKNQDGHLVIKGDNFGDAANQEAIINQLRQKLGIKVVLQMENAQGNVVFERTVSPTKLNEEGNLSLDSNSMDTSSATLTETGDKENDDVNTIVKSVVNTIRDLKYKMSDMKPCPVCGDIVTGYHYGVQTCESCKGFFKRTVQNKKTHTCHRGGTCEITLTSRKKCGACRFRKCCEVGMKVEGIREDRSRGGRSSYDGASYNFQRRSLSSTPVPTKRTRYIDSPVSASCRSFSQPIVPTIMQQILNLETMYEETSASPMDCCVDKLTNCDKHKFSSMLHITEHRLYQIVRWARNLPNFLTIQTDDQILLLQNSWAELVSLGAIWRSRFSPGVIQLSFGKTIDIHKAREMDHEEVISRMLHVCTNFRRLQVDKYEYVTLKVLALMLPDIKGLKDVNTIQQYQNKLLDALMLYTSTHYPQFPTKFGELLLRLSEVQRFTAMARKQIIQKTASGEIPEYGLMMELMRGTAGVMLNAATEASQNPPETGQVIAIQEIHIDPTQTTVEPGDHSEGINAAAVEGEVMTVDEMDHVIDTSQEHANSAAAVTEDEILVQEIHIDPSNTSELSKAGADDQMHEETIPTGEESMDQ